MYNSLSYKTKQFFWLLIKLAIVIGCGYFIYQKLLRNDDLQFSYFWLNLTKNNLLSLKSVFFLFIFTLFNWLLEIKKWHLLILHIKKYSFSKAITQSLASLTTSLITPNGIGEYGAKAIYFEKPYRKQIVGLNLVGNFYQMLMTILFGIIGFSYFVWQHNVSIDFCRVFRGLFLGICTISVFFFGVNLFNYKGYSVKKAKIFINKTSLKLNLQIALLSFFRFSIFSHQFYYLTLIFNINISYLTAISTITSVYFIASIVPILSLFDVVLKGTIAVWLFSYFNIEPITILSITTIMWLFNFVLPAIIGSYFILSFKPIFTK